jgi:GT2 family glycosyltransferase
LRSNIGQLRELLSVWEIELGDKTRQLADLQESALSVGAELKWREEQVAAFEQNALALRAELKWQEELERAQQAQQTELGRVRTGGQQRIAQLGSELSELRGSFSWRLTAPLREAYRLWDRIRRAVWRQEYQFRVVPALQLRSVEQNVWEAQGPNPQFLLIPTSRSGRLPGRWCEIEIGLDHADGLQQPVLYLDTGAGFADLAIRLPPHERGQLKTAIELRSSVRALRLAPRQEPGRFEIRDVLIREITREGAKQVKEAPATEPSVMSVDGPSTGFSSVQSAELSAAEQHSADHRTPTPTEVFAAEQPPAERSTAEDAATMEAVPSEELMGAGGSLEHIEFSVAGQASPDRAPALDLKAVVRDRLKAEFAAFLASGAELVMPQPKSPLISIVLVLYNQAELTYNCLCSIIAHAGDDSEVIIVDNASTDSTDELLKRIRGAIMIHNAENLYFPHACNQGSEQAHGKYLLLLNNDAQLLPGSLQAAVRVLEQDESIGAVGGRILNLSGRLQEAGCILWSDGSTRGYGRGDISDDPKYMFRRDVDFCSAAFLLMRTKSFRENGGFDEVFSPGYYEEVDFCVRLWKQNLRVVYEPRATIVHFEYGSSDSAFAATLTARNCQMFRFKHGDYLAGRLAPDPKNELRARYARAPRMHVLFIDDRIPHLDQGSGYPRANAIVNAMTRMGAAVTVFPMTSVQEPWHQAYRDLRPEIEVMADASADSLAGFLKERRRDYHVIFVSRPHNMGHLLGVLRNRSFLGQCRLIYDAEAVFALRTQERARIMGEGKADDASRELLEELQLAASADEIICVSDLERRHFVEHGPRSVHVLGHSLRPQPTSNTFEERRDILFVGAMNAADSPNEDSVLWFARHVLPLVRARLPKDVRLIVVGQNTAQRLAGLADDPAVEVAGSIADLAPYYEHARIFVAPTRFAAGIPIKILEAAARGLPIVATSLLAAQLGWVDGEQLLTAPAGDPEKFADQCVRLYTGEQLWLQIQEQALKRVQQDCDPHSFEEKLKAILARCRPLGWITAVDSMAADSVSAQIEGSA